MITAVAGDPFEATVDNAPTGLVGVIGYKIEDSLGNTVVARTTAGIVAAAPTSYIASVAAAPAAGLYVFVWDTGGSSPTYATETMTVTANPDLGDSVYACTLDQIDAVLNRGGTSTNYNDDLKTAARDVATAAFERKANCSARVQTRTERLDGVGGEDLLLSRARPLTVLSLSIAGTTVDPSTIEVLTEDGTLYRAGGWGGSYVGGYGSSYGGNFGVTTARRSILVTYTYGFDPTPDDLSNAIAVLASSLIKDGPFDDRGYGVTDDGGFVRLLTAGVGNASFSIPEVQAALVRYRIPAIA